ncbi:flagellar biosynthesis anti-sigma factor FlgM [Desulfurobacterium thermolithotrophum]|uniref:flagellar biosynthesis anti-sigma factor FlgM n=1 Tax=Desulfurobacterium thermolithotrophum TaxID=64160 RepID=UPI0013D7C450|nr:flagellar biosynthesis anti-sigma factor FlgM [Desulfurobacterium thermolithotrophum]
MKINNLSSEILKLIGKEVNFSKTGEKKKSSTEADSQKNKGVIVDLSEELNINISLEPPPKEKIEEIKKAIKEGNYSIDIHRLSEAILKDILGE